MDTLSADLILLMHIPKTGGTSLKSHIRSCFPETSLFELNPRFTHEPDRFESSDLDQLSYKPLNETDILKFREFSVIDSSRIVMGHFPFGIHQHTDRNCRYVTFIRKPEELVISLYHEMHRSDDPIDHKIVNRFENLLSFSHSVRNVQTFILSGLPSYKDVVENETLALQKALKNIDMHFDFVGRIERFDSSLKRLFKLLKTGRPHYRFHQKKGMYNKLNTDHRTLQIIHENNVLDIELYNYVSKKFKTGLF